MRLLFLICAGLLLSACATTAKYEAKLEEWIGESESELVSQWGVPNSSYPLSNGTKLIMYLTNSSSASVPVGNVYFTDYYWCKTTFTISESGEVKSWKHEGNSCKSR